MIRTNLPTVDSSPPRPSVQTVIPILTIVVAAAVVPAVAFGLVLQYTVNVPFWDEWGQTPWIIDFHQGRIPWGKLWEQHNEHRVIVPNLLLLALTRFGSWNVRREAIFNIGLVVLQLAIVWNIVRATLPRRTGPYAFFALSLLTFSLAQVENFSWGAAGLGWFVPNVFSTFALYLLTKRDVGTNAVIVAFVSCTLAAFSEAPGLMSLFEGAVILAVRSPFQARRLGVWIAATAGVVAIYLHGYVNASGPGFRLHPSDIFTTYPQYVLAYLGAPLGSWKGLRASEILGGFGLIVFAVGAWRFFAKRVAQGTDYKLLPWLALAAFAVPNSILTGFGRAGLGLDQSLSSRYTTISSDLWYGVVGLLVLIVPPAFDRVRAAKGLRIATIVAASIAFAFLFAREQLVGFHLYAAHAATLERARTALSDTAAATDADLVTLYPDPAYVRRSMRQLQNAGIAF